MPKTAKGGAKCCVQPDPAQLAAPVLTDGWTDRGQRAAVAPQWDSTPQDGTVMPAGLASHCPGSTPTLLKGWCTASPAL